jgi:hypothetical protein
MLLAVSLWLVAPVAARAEMLLVDGSLTASDGAKGDHLGQAIAVSGDVLVTTATFAPTGGIPTGAAYVFERDPATGAWVERKKLMPPDGAAFDKFGTSVAVAGDTVAIGAPWADIAGVREQGAVYAFERNAGGADNWGEVAKLTDAGVGGSGDLGAALALAGDLLAVGAPNADHLQGRVLLFERDRGGLTPGARSRPSRTPMSGVPAPATAAGLPSSAARSRSTATGCWSGRKAPTSATTTRTMAPPTCSPATPPTATAGPTPPGWSRTRRRSASAAASLPSSRRNPLMCARRWSAAPTRTAPATMTASAPRSRSPAIRR